MGIKTVFKTSDGKLFDQHLEAQDHESTIVDSRSAQELSGALWNYLTDKTDFNLKSLIDTATKYRVEHTIRKLFVEGQ
jgi:hypothetical protein